MLSLGRAAVGACGMQGAWRPLVASILTRLAVRLVYESQFHDSGTGAKRN